MKLKHTHIKEIPIPIIHSSIFPTQKRRLFLWGMSFVFLCMVIGFFVQRGHIPALNPFQTQLKGEDTGRTNFMIYGLTLDGNRTDTMMLVSYYWKENTLVTLNIPRDLYATYKGYSGKIVSLYTFAKAHPNTKDDPATFVDSFISQEYGIPIQYHVVINMDGFRQLVDSLGGVAIHVVHAFTDYTYPTDNYSGYIYPAPHFDTGYVLMDGKTALIYARSRHSPDAGEGTDFARSRRQQQVISATITAMKANGILGNITKIQEYLTIFHNNIATNLSLPEEITLAQIGEGLNLSTQYKSIDWGYNSGFFCNKTLSTGEDVILYGVLGNCNGKAGSKTDSVFQQKAITEVQDLLAQAMQASSTSSPNERRPK